MPQVGVEKECLYKDEGVPEVLYLLTRPFVVVTLQADNQQWDGDRPIASLDNIRGICEASLVEIPAIVSINDVGAIGESSAIEVLTIPGIEDVRAIGKAATIEMLSVPSIENI